jgi:hypothetical protein
VSSSVSAGGGKAVVSGRQFLSILAKTRIADEGTVAYFPKEGTGEEEWVEAMAD